jgi:N-acetylglucosaminyldiphosphoundecaprenol N-acetyl-beta-D-mannosaminyltransferase
MGVPISNVTMDSVVEFVNASIQEGGFHQVATANVDYLNNAIHDTELQRILYKCDLVIPDGMPLLWVARLLNRPLRERVCGADLVPRLAELSVCQGYRMFLLGASEATSRQATENLLERYPGLRICGRYSPPLTPLNQMNHEEILRRIEDAQPDILLVAFGNPKQEKWLAMHRDRLTVPVCIGVGGSLDFIAGAIARAPKWMCGIGLEWAYRFLQEPRRLAQRYFSDAGALALYVPQQFVPHALQPWSRTHSQVFSESAENAIIISIHGNLRGESLKEFVAIARCAIKTGKNIVLNMSRTTFLGIDMLGELIRLRSRLSPVQYLWLSGLRQCHVRVLHGAKLDAHFMTVSSVRDAMNNATRAEQRGDLTLVRATTRQE